MSAYSPAITDIPHDARAQSRSRSVRERFILFLSIVLLGYALAGRGFAYIGVPPLFVGEIALLFGMASLATACNWQELLACRFVWPLLAFFAWGALRTAPFLGIYGVECLRDGVVWGYGVFAVVIAALILDDTNHLTLLISLYRRFYKLFLIGIPLAFIAYRYSGASMPRWPWADAKILQVKEGDAMVHLAGIMAFWVSGLAGEIGWGWVALLTLDAVILGVIDRAGMISFLAIFAISMAYRPRHGVALKAIGVIATLALLLWASNLRVPVPDGKGREISFSQIVQNLGSVTGDTGTDGLDSTKEWRMDWWNTIISYTLHGKYFWTGKGFGINLADDDGFQLLSDHSLRNPHSVHMTMLARGGVPMLLLWASAIASWFWLMGKSFLYARRHTEPLWEGMFFFLPAYLLAFLINGSFDVFIEGPMGGIWLWSIYGTGLGAALIFRREIEANAR